MDPLCVEAASSSSLPTPAPRSCLAIPANLVCGSTWFLVEGPATWDWPVLGGLALSRKGGGAAGADEDDDEDDDVEEVLRDLGLRGCGMDCEEVLGRSSHMIFSRLSARHPTPASELERVLH